MTDEQAGPALDAEVARQKFGVDVLGMAWCRRDPECGEWNVTADHEEDDEGDEQRFVYAATRYVPTRPGFACGCLEVREEYLTQRSAWLAEKGFGPDDPEEGLVLGHDWTCLNVVEEYSTDIAAAWLVVEQMRASGFSFEMSDHDERTHRPVWEVLFRGPIADGWATEDTPALAICRAALAATRGQQEDR